MNRRYLFAAIALVIAAVAAVVFAANTSPNRLGGGTAAGDSSPLPPLDAKGWINTPPLTTAQLKGKVVVYDVWTYSCVNCVRTIPYVRSWYDRYKKDGLVVIGVHSPEFQFEKNHANVARAVKKLGVDYPVALDDDMTIWNELNNEYWPADYIYNRAGKQVSTHFGEGGYTETENELRKLLGVPSSSPRAKVGAMEGGSDTSTDLTGETYNGSERGAEGFASPEVLANGTHTYTTPDQLDPGYHALSGKWQIDDEYVQSAAAGASISIRYQASQVNLVLAPSGSKPVDAVVKVDGKVVKTVHVTAADLYSLVAVKTFGTHTLQLVANGPGLRAYAFTFGG
ncbi:MAG TPA: redoxin family protein [Acidimicrobiales bacterium]